MIASECRDMGTVQCLTTFTMRARRETDGSIAMTMCICLQTHDSHEARKHTSVTVYARQELINSYTRGKLRTSPYTQIGVPGPDLVLPPWNL